MDGGCIEEMRHKTGDKRQSVKSENRNIRKIPARPPVNSMDDSGIEKMIKKQERGYIWLEQELKKNLGISTAGIAAFFLFLLPADLPLSYFAALFAGAVLANGIWCYLTYRRKYRDYLEISDCLEELETGSYRGQESPETENYRVVAYDRWKNTKDVRIKNRQRIEKEEEKLPCNMIVSLFNFGFFCGY